jgi:predicted RNase H-like nuclease (RuvC/YqgF family)
MDNCDILRCLNAVGWLSATQGRDSIEYSQVDVPMTQSKDNDDSVSREEFKAVQDQVGYLTEKISELSEKLKELEDRVENLEDDTDDRAN